MTEAKHKNAYSLLHCHDHQSHLDGFGYPEDNVKRAKEVGLNAISITNHGSCYSHLEHLEACKKHDIKGILGNELYVVHKDAFIKEASNRQNSHMVVWAKNFDGWKSLIALTSNTNNPKYYYYKPRISLYNSIDLDGNEYRGLEWFTANGNIQGFSGHQGSHLSDNLFCDLYSDDHEKKRADLRTAYGQYKEKDIEFYRKFLKPNWLESTCKLALELERIFGKGNFFVEIQNSLNPKDKLALWIHPLIQECLRIVAKETNIPPVASFDPHYPTKDHAEDQRTMVMVNMKETEESVKNKLDDETESDMMVFFGSDEFYIKSPEEIDGVFTQEEIDNTNKIAELIETYDIKHQPYVPTFAVPEFPKERYTDRFESDTQKYLMYLCVEGAKKLQPWTISGIDKQKYWERLSSEFDTISQAEVLSSYFLIVWDICMAADNRPSDQSFDWTKNTGNINPVIRSVGRGSASGCLISYLIGITNVDPLLYNLSFARFFNPARLTKDNVSLPDIDLDFSVDDREWVIGYIAWKYGRERVAQMITFSKMAGRAAIKDVFRVKGIDGGFELANKICEYVPNEAEIADEIQAMKDDGEEDYNIIRWALDNSETFKQYYDTSKDIKECIDKAMRLEGRIRGKSKHASGVVITPKNIDECFPMSYDPKSKETVVGIDMRDAEKMGALKFDILGVTVLDKLKMTQDLVNA